MGQKTNNRILWHGNELNAEGKAVAPVKAVAGGDGTDGLNEGELYICNSDSDPALFILTDAGNVVRIDGNGSDTYTREQINEKLNAKVDVAFFSRMFWLIDEEGGEIQVNDVETLASSIKAKLGFWTEQYLSAKGLNSDAGSEVSGATTLAALTDVSITATPADKQVLAYDAALGKWKPVTMEATAGVDEEELLQILTQKGYATQTWVTQQSYATQQWVTQQSYAKTSVRIKAGTGLAGGGTLAQDVTLSLATVGTAGTYTKVTVDSYGRVTGHASLTQGDIPALAISKITGLQTALDAKLNKSVFEELFEKVWVSGYGYAIRAKLAFYSDDWISAKGLNSDAGSTTGGVDENEVLQIVEDAGYIKSAALNGYATQSWVNSQGYLTQATADGRYAYKDGSNASGTWGIGITGNAGTATKLQTARTIWGQSFNGTANVSGDMNGVGIIYFANGGNLRNNSEDTFSLYTGVDAASLKVKSLLASGSYATDVAEGCVRASVGVIADSYVQVGSGRIYYDSTNNALYVQKSDGTVCGFYATGFVSAKGLNGDGGSASAGLDEEQLAEYLTENGYATQQWVTGKNYITSAALADYAKKSDIPSLAGYLTQATADGRYFRKSIDTISDTATDSDDLYGCGIYLNVTGNTGTNSSFPSGYGLLLNFAYQEGNFRTQLYADRSGLRFNYRFDGSIISDWRRLLDVSNIGSYALTPSNYTTYTVTKTGGGASGTWGIGISGNAATATKLQTARTIWGQSFNGTANVSGDMNGVGIIYFANGGNLRNNSEDTFSLYTGVDAANLKVKSLLASGSYATDVAEGCVRASVGVIADSYVQVGSGRIYYDSTNNALYVQKSDGTVCGFYATGFLSAKGKNSEAGSATAGVTTLAELEDVTISSPANGQSLVYRNGTWRNEMVSGGGSASVAWDDITGIPDWIGDLSPTFSVTSSASTNLNLKIGSQGRPITALYATYLGGTTKAGLFSDLTYSGNTLTIVIGGTKRTATIEAGGGGVSSVSVTSSSSRNISVTVDGHTDYVNDVYATYSTYADQLRTARTIWGQSFNGGSSISGNMTGVGILYFSNNTNIRAVNSSTVGIYASNNAGGLMVKSLYIGTTYNGSAGDGLLVVNNNGNAVTIGAQNATFCHIYNSKSIPFMFNNTVASTAGDLGTTQFRWATVYAKNALNTSSDLRLKTILQDIPLTVEQVAAAPSFLYRWKKDTDGRAYAGSSAQYWQKALPQAVLKGEDGYLSMEYDRLALAAVITTARTVVDHEQRIRRLEDALKVAV